MSFGNRKAVRTGLVAVAAASLMVWLGACSSGGGGGRTKESTKAVESIGDVADQLKQAPKHVDAVNAAITKLEAGGDTQAAYKEYTSSVAQVEGAAKKARARRDAMMKNRDAYIAKWQKDVETIQNPEVKAALAERKNKVAANFDQIRDSAVAVRDAYEPYMKTLKEIQQGLAMDLNPSGVAALKKPLDTAKANGETLKQKIGQLETKLREIEGSMTPAAAQKK